MKTIQVLSQREAEATDFTGVNVISIVGQNAKPATINNAASVLRLAFDDTLDGEGRMTEADAAAVLDFIAGLPTDARLVVHCAAGVSRSPAVADALATIGAAEWVNAGDTVWTPEGWMARFFPNPVVKTLIVREYMRRSGMSIY